MRPIYLFWSSEISEEEAGVALQAITEIGRFLPEEIHIQTFGNWFQGREPFQSLKWYEEKAWLPARKQLNGGSILIDFLVEPWQEKRPHIDFAVFGRDLTVQYEGHWLNFVFGVSYNWAGIVSTFRFNREIRDAQLRSLCLKRAVQHEFCHILGLVPEWRKSNIDNRLGPHCKNICVMRQGMSVGEWARFAQQESNKGVILCSQCQEDLLTFFRRRSGEV